MDISWYFLASKKTEGTDGMSDFDLFQPWLAPPSGSTLL